MSLINELRVGNLLRGGKVASIDCSIVTFNSKYKKGRGYGESHSNCKPIPLTEEWLVKFGFEKSSWFVLKSEYLHELNVNICISLDAGLTSIGRNEETLIKHVQYVHELENLYFSLTKVELRDLFFSLKKPNCYE